MNNDRFNQVINDRIKLCTDVLLKKAGEYATDTDRLHNFKIAANMQGLTPRQALAGMMAKHTVSVYDMASSDKEFPAELWEEKIGDHLNYLLLLAAVIQEEQDEKPQAKVVSGQFAEGPYYNQTIVNNPGPSEEDILAAGKKLLRRSQGTA